MKCFNHEDRDAAATCQRCGKGLCKECASKYTPCLCDDCFAAIQAENHTQEVAAVERRKQGRLENLSFTKGDLILNCVLGVVAALVWLYYMQGNNYESYTLSDYLLAVPVSFCFPAGWRLVGRFFRAGEGDTTIIWFGDSAFITFFLALFLKVIVGTFLGIPAFLFQVYKVIRAKNDVKAAEAELIRVKR